MLTACVTLAGQTFEKDGLSQIAGGKACNQQLSEALYNRTVMVGRTISHYKIGGWTSERAQHLARREARAATQAAWISSTRMRRAKKPRSKSENIMNRIVRWLGVGLVAVFGWSAPAQHHALGGHEHVDIRSGVFRGQPVTYQVIDGLAVWESDIILGMPEELQPAEGMVPIKGADNS